MFARDFYLSLFERRPDFRILFKASMQDQENHFLTAIGSSIAGLKRPHEIVPYLRELGARHVDYGVKEQDFDIFIQTFHETMQVKLGSDYTTEIKEAWNAAFQTILDLMSHGYRK